MNGIEKTSTRRWITALSEVKEGQKNAGLYAAVLKLASKPRRERVSVNLEKLNMHAKDSENIIVPGKVLATGVLGKKFSIAAIEYSAAAMQHLKAAGCQIVPIEEMLKKDSIRVIV